MHRLKIITLFLPLAAALVLTSGIAGAKPNKARMTVFILPDKTVSQQDTARISHAFIRALRDNENLVVKDPDKLLVEFAGEVPSAAIADAKDELERGLKLLKARRAEEAASALQQAISGLEPTLAFIKKSTLARAAMALGVAQARQGKKSAAARTFRALLTWRPRLNYDTKRFPNRYLPIWISAQDAVKKRPKGSVELTSTPPGAKAYVDGRFVGVTPTTAFGLRAGKHYATYKMAGYVKAAQVVKVNSRAQARYKKELKRSDKFLLLKQTLNTLKKELGQAEASAAMVDLRSFLFIDQVVFARVLPAETGAVAVKAYLYDLRSRMRLNQASRTMAVAQLGNLKDLSRSIYTNVRYDGTLEAPEEPEPPPPPKRTPFYATWWFWTAVGVVVAGAVTAGVLWPDSRSCAENFRCVTLSN